MLHWPVYCWFCIFNNMQIQKTNKKRSSVLNEQVMKICNLTSWLNNSVMWPDWLKWFTLLINFVLKKIILNVIHLTQTPDLWKDFCNQVKAGYSNFYLHKSEKKLRKFKIWMCGGLNKWRRRIQIVFRSFNKMIINQRN